VRPWQWIIHERSTNSSMVMLLSLFRPLCLPALMKLVAIEGKVDHNTPEQERQDGLPVGCLSPSINLCLCDGTSESLYRAVATAKFQVHRLLLVSQVAIASAVESMSSRSKSNRR
jgi:hypothetical protein